MQTGFANHFATEAVPGALPLGRNSPQKAPLGLYAEQLSGTAFTEPRAKNRRSWLYRIRPALAHGAFTLLQPGNFHNRFNSPGPNQLRWSPPQIPVEPTDFLGGLFTMAGNATMAVHMYTANKAMERFFYNADAEMVILPQEGALTVHTELGVLPLVPHEIAVIPRGVRFRIDNAVARGYVCENFRGLLTLPELGPIGSNGLANPRDFQTPVAAFEDREGDFALVCKFQGALWQAAIGHSPLDVVAWHGNYAPYKYDLRLFNTMGSISYDHPDPSIFTVLTNNELDVVIFPPRWLVAQDTFHPPWFHRNVASEFMGLISGVYDAKAEGFSPGGASLHNCMSGHGPDAATFDKASSADLSKPDVIKDTMAFMLETRDVIGTTDQSIQRVQPDYQNVWGGLRKFYGTSDI